MPRLHCPFAPAPTRRPSRWHTCRLGVAWGLLLAWTAPHLPRAADPLVVGGVTYSALRTARHSTYDYSLELQPAAGTAQFDRIDILLAMNDNAEGGRFLWDASGFRLYRIAGEHQEVLASGTGPIPGTLRDGGKLVVKRRAHWFEIVADRRRVLRLLDDALRGRGAAASTAPGSAQVADIGYQRVADIVFGDDFMRTEEETKDFGQWEPVSGEWRLHSVMEEVRANPDARIREGREPVAERIVNPFSLSGTSAEGAVILTGHLFWDQYSVAVSAKTNGGQVGVVFGAVDADNLWVARWQVLHTGVRPGALELVHRVAGQDRLVETVCVAGRTDNWYRLEARTVGPRIDVLVDGTPVITTWDDFSVGGRIGLWAQGGKGGFFDDVEVKSWPAIAFECADTLAGHAAALAGGWDIAGDRGKLTFTTTGRTRRGQESTFLYAMGHPSWQRLTFHATVDRLDVSKGTGLVFGVAGMNDYWRFEWSDEAGGRAALARVSKGEEHVLAHGRTALDPRRPHELALDLREEGIAKLLVDGELELRHRLSEAVIGRVGLFATGKAGVVFRTVEAFAEPRRFWEHPVDSSVFIDDPYMQGWASPRWAWVRLRDAEAPDGGPRLYQHKGDFYGPFRVTAPLSHGMSLLFGSDSVRGSEGYRVSLTLDQGTGTGNVALTRDGRETARSEFQAHKREVVPGEQIVDEKIGALPRASETISHGTLTVNREGKYVWVSVDDHELLAVRDEQPPEGRALGLEVVESLDLAKVAVERGSVLDYIFEKAAVDWLKVGDWQVTNRFACDPRWSHMAGRSMGVAALWNKHAIENDFTIECYAGMRMRQGEMHEGSPRNYYPRVGDINVALCSEGRDLFSGYNLIIAAWDPAWSERWTQFWRKAELVEQTDRELIPRTRNDRPTERAIEVEWDPGGRPIHGAWYYVKIRRTGPRFDVFFDNTHVLSYTDADPLAGRHLALWTQHNSIVVARAKIGCRRVNKGGGILAAAPEARAPVLPDSQPSPSLLCPTHPSLLYDFEKGLQGWERASGDQGAELSLTEGGKDRGNHSLRVVNTYAGGDVGVELPLPELDLGRVAWIEMDCAVPPQVSVNLYIRLREDPMEQAWVQLSGPAHDVANMVGLGAFESFKPDGKWRRVRFGLSQALRKAFPQRKTFVVERMLLGYLHEGYLNAGLGGNPEGASYLLDNVTIVGTGPMTVDAAWTGLAANATPPALTASRRPNQAGPPRPKSAGPAAEIALESPGLWYLHSTMEGKPSGLAPLPVWAERPMAVEATHPAAGDAWGGQALSVRFTPRTLAHLDLTTAKLTAAGQDVPLAAHTATYDPHEQTLDVDLSSSGLVFDDGADVELAFTYSDNLAWRMPVADTAQTATGEKAADGAKPPTVSPSPKTHRWTCRMAYKRDRVPPGVVRLDPEQYPLLHFDGTPSPARVHTGKNGVKLVYRAREEGGRDLFLEAVNRICGSDFGVDIGLPKFNAGKYPLMAFDYRTSEDVRADFLIGSSGGRHVIGFTDTSVEDPKLGDIPGIVKDGAWHHVEFSLEEMIGRQQTNFAPRQYDVKSVVLGDWGYAAMPPGASHAIDNVTLVPAISTGKSFELKWSVADPSGISAYSYVWDAHPLTEADKTPETAENAATFTGLVEGTAYFHIRARDGAGNWGTTAHYRFIVDNTSPAIAAVDPPDETASASGAVRIRFADSLAAIDPGSFTLRMGGAKCALSPAYTSWDTENRELAWRWVQAKRRMKAPIPDGQTMSFQLESHADFAGNEAEPMEWTWKIDYAQDKQGPDRPGLVCTTQKLLQFDDFGNGVGNWQAYGRGKYGTEVSTVVDEELQDACLRITKTERARLFGAYAYRGQLNPESYRFLSFDCKIPEGVSANLILHLNGEWRAVLMTGEEALPIVGRIESVRADGRWHHAHIDLHEMLRESMPDDEKFTIRYIVLGTWQTAANKPGACVYVDNFALLAPGAPLPVLYCNAVDATGIQGYSFGLDRDPRGPAHGTEFSEWQLALPAIDAEGMWYVHVRAKDGAGNLGQTATYPYFCESPVPASGEDGFEADTTWRIQGGRGTRCGANAVKTASAKNSILAVTAKTWRQDTLHLQHPGRTVLRRRCTLSADLYQRSNLRKPLRIAAYVRTGPGEKDVVVSEPVELAAGVWARDATFELDLQPLVTGKETPDGTVVCQEKGFIVYAPARLNTTLVLDDLRFLPLAKAARE